jgi:hypothetical protein
MDAEKIKEIEAKMADLEGRWPSHSVSPGMWLELEELEEELEKARGGQAEDDGAEERRTEGGDAEAGAEESNGAEDRAR